MLYSPETVLADAVVRAALRQAWIDAEPGLTGGHETGGFIVCTAQGQLQVVRWPEGTLDLIKVPPHVGCHIDGKEIVASFHTHPNTGPNYHQVPNDYDVGYVSNDQNLKGANYVGEFVISEKLVYLIAPDGQTSTIGLTANIIGVTT